jgi:hypothetical protein
MERTAVARGLGASGSAISVPPVLAIKTEMR